MESKDINIGCNWEEISMKSIQVGDEIGGGGFAIVYDGIWKKRKVALKTLFDPRVDEDLKDEFMKELFVMSQIDHPHIVTLYGACVRAPNFCMVMELCDDSLFSIVHCERQQLSAKVIVKMMCQLASALEYLHGRNPSVIHRDIKSQNVLVSKDGQVKLCDFGLVESKITTAGTPSYMAPELLENGHFSRKVDSWGIADIREFVIQGNRLKLPYEDCPKLCCKLIEKCWDQDAQKRPEFKNVSLALERIYSSIREVSHTVEVHGIDGDSFDQLTASVQKKK